MYSLQLSPEQLEIRDTIRDFVTREVKPVVLKSDRLDVNDRSLPMDLLTQASQMGLRSLALSEQAGGAGADTLTSCIVTEELAAGDADFAAILAETSWLSHVIFDRGMNEAQRGKFLPKFLADDQFHLAFAADESGSDTRLGVNYHRAAAVQATAENDGREGGKRRVDRQRRQALRRQCADRPAIRGAGQYLRPRRRAAGAGHDRRRQRARA